MAKSDDYVSSDSDSDAYYDANAGDGNDDQKKISASGKGNGLEDVPLGANDTVDDKEKGAIVAVDDDEAEEYDEDELPWQVIALLDRSVLEDLRFSSACRDEKVDRALKGLDVQQPCQSTTVEGFLEAERVLLQSSSRELLVTIMIAATTATSSPRDGCIALPPRMESSCTLPRRLAYMSTMTDRASSA